MKSPINQVSEYRRNPWAQLVEGECIGTTLQIGACWGIRVVCKSRKSCGIKAMGAKTYILRKSSIEKGLKFSSIK